MKKLALICAFLLIGSAALAADRSDKAAKFAADVITDVFTFSQADMRETFGKAASLCLDGAKPEFEKSLEEFAEFVASRNGQSTAMLAGSPGVSETGKELVNGRELPAWHVALPLRLVLKYPEGGLGADWIINVLVVDDGNGFRLAGISSGRMESGDQAEGR